MNSQDVIRKLGLVKHPEGYWYRPKPDTPASPKPAPPKSEEGNGDDDQTGAPSGPP